MNSEMDEIEQQIAALQEKKNQLKISDTQDKLNNFCKNISEISLSDIKTTIESKIKKDLYDNCIKKQYGYWQKMNYIDYCHQQDYRGGKIDETLPEILNNNLLDKSIFHIYYYKYEIKLFIQHRKNKYINVDNFDFIVNNGDIENCILLFKSKEPVINSTSIPPPFYYATYFYKFPDKYSIEFINKTRILINQSEIIELQNKPLKIPNEPEDITVPLYLNYKLICEMLK